MDGNGTDTWVIVLAAFGGGLAGAILQPILSYFMHRLTSGDEIRRDRQRSLRRMLVSEIRWTRKRQAWATSKALEQSLGIDLAVGPLPFMGGPFWEPERIEDAELRKKVKEYSERGNAIVRATHGAPTIDEAEVKRLDSELNDSQQRITARMDSLNWPEADVEDA